MQLLEKASNIAVILAALAVTGTVVYDRVVRSSQAQARFADTFSARYKGKKFPVDGFESGTPVVFLFVSKNCHFCDESMPFYRRLAAIRTASQGRLRVSAIIPKANDTEPETKAHFSERGIALDGAQAISFSAIGVLGTPTLALVDNDGVVTAVWTGKLPQEKETEMIERIFAVCKGCIRENGRGN